MPVQAAGPAWMSFGARQKSAGSPTSCAPIWKPSNDHQPRCLGTRPPAESGESRTVRLQPDTGTFRPGAHALPPEPIPFADQFLLKGALLFTLWYDQPHRPTRDADLLGFGSSDLASLWQTFMRIAGMEVHDGILFHPDSVQVDAIRKEASYGGARVLIGGELANARCKTQIDIGWRAATAAHIRQPFYKPTPGTSLYFTLRGKILAETSTSKAALYTKIRGFFSSNCPLHIIGLDEWLNWPLFQQSATTKRSTPPGS